MNTEFTGNINADCEKIAETVARALAFLSSKSSDSDTLSQSRRHLEQLNAAYPNNIPIAYAYGEGLLCYAENLRERGSIVIYMEMEEKLNALAEKYPDEGNVTLWARLLHEGK